MDIGSGSKTLDPLHLLGNTDNLFPLTDNPCKTFIFYGPFIYKQEKPLTCPTKQNITIGIAATS